MFFLYSITVTQQDDGVFLAECKDVQGAWSEGNSADEAVENCKDAIKGVIQYHQEHNLALPAVKNIQEKRFTLEYPLSYA